MTNYDFSETIGSAGALTKEDCMKKRVATTTGSAIGVLVLGLLVSLALPSAAAWAQAPVAQSFGVAVNTPLASGTSPLAVLPADGGLVTNNSPSVDVAGVAGAENAFAMASGAEGSAESNSTLESVSLLNGLITADGVMALASSAITDAGTASSNAEGSQLANLVVNGMAVPSDVAPNTRVDLPGVGYAVLNEQTFTGDGVTSSGITVNMIHVVLQTLTGGGCTLLGCLPGVLTTTGEIIVGSATSSVQ